MQANVKSGMRYGMAVTLAVFTAAALPASAFGDLAEFTGGSIFGLAEWDWFNPDTGKGDGDGESIFFSIGSNGGSGQTGGGVDGVLFLELFADLSLLTSGDEPGRVNLLVEGSAWFNDECCEGFVSAFPSLEADFVLNARTPFYITGNDPALLTLTSNDTGEQIPQAGILEPGSYEFFGFFSLEASDQNPGPNELFKTWRLVFAVPGDLDGDGIVDVFDLLILLAEWGECPDPVDCLPDFNGDGVVDVFDLLILLENWG